MIRLKSLELQGYKTFATKTEFDFAGGITAIVGPNGSGKSNIADAIRWVLGEQSYGLLRGKKTEDMIFSGSELRPRAGMASATLVFDNSDGWLPIEFAEVAIARRAYRDGENEYLLNRQRVRLKDLEELLARCGLSERTYTIIGQGLIDSALSLKAEERRALFEEAAGIGLYRSKREDALRRLETTQRNLDRVQDILAELRPRLRSLERQAHRARDHAQVRADLKALLRQWYGYHWHAAQASLVAAHAQAQAQARGLAEAQTEQDRRDRELIEARGIVSDLRAQLNGLHRESAARHAEWEAVSRSLAVAEERTRALREKHETLQGDLPELESRLALDDERLAAAQAELDATLAQLEESQREAEVARQAIQSHEAERAALEERERVAREAVLSISASRAEVHARQSALAERRSRQVAAVRDAATALSKSEAALAQSRARAETASARAAEAQAERARRRSAAEDISRRIAKAEARQAETAQALVARRAEEHGLRARAEVLEQAARELAGYAEGTRLLLDAARGQRLDGVLGPLGERLSVPAEFERAIAGALGAFLDAVVLDGESSLETALDLLDRPEAGRAALLPLDRLSPAPTLIPPDDPDCLGRAADLVTAGPDLRPIIDLLLGQTLVVADWRAARRMLTALPRRATVVTLKGEVFHASGPVIAGKDSASSSLARGREKRELSAHLESAQRETRAAEAASARAESELLALRQELTAAQSALAAAETAERAAAEVRAQERLRFEQAQREEAHLRQQVAALESEINGIEAEEARLHARAAELDAERERARGELQTVAAARREWASGDLARQLAHWETQMAVATRAASDSRARLGELTQARTTTAAALAERRERAEHLAGESRGVIEATEALRQREADMAAATEALRLQFEPVERQLTEAEAGQRALEERQDAARAAMHAAEHRHAQAQLEWARKQEEVEHLRRRIEEDFGLVEFDYVDEMTGPTPLPLGELVEKLERVEGLPEGLEESLNRKRSQLRRMGAINPEAQTEYAEVKERVEFLTTQVGDLHKAEAQLREVIAEMDGLMEREFKRTFEAVSVEFRDAFTRLFDGGSARLILTDPEDVNASGIDITARLPGKRAQGLSSLSGGERSLTAIALIFALLKVSPTPFCVLDEVDAMLDEANVARFRDMLKELAEQTQFIVITHNRHTVQAAEVIYGVTMGADSASQVIGLKLEEAARHMKVA